MKRRLSPWCRQLILILIISLPSSAIAVSIHGTVTFIKKPPLVGIAYVPAEQSSIADAEIDQLDKQFTSKMVVIKPGDSVTFKNSDNVEHNVFANDVAQSAKFDVGLMPPGEEKQIVVDWKENSIVRVGCKIHPKMRTYLASIDTPYHKIIEFENGKQQYSFTINNIPEGSEVLYFKVPKYDVVAIDITDSTSWTMDITKKNKIRGHVTIDKK
ncbi:plastocyanin/azurin family copper-binding protein [Shewanella sp. TC10]|uniref:plastocyanin/azurin family copper-binding protein n=1 Tax=Shewanella sp. TC10 TaxID=1419739 RepID=UPI00129E6B4A|nr:plastocyanin/azurin family copper-binding protein [Shewanella sp. TC10]